VYNKTLETRKKGWEQEKQSISLYDTMKMLPAWKQDRPKLRLAFSQTLQDACSRVDLAFNAFFRRVKAGETPGYPRFKGYYRYDSFTYKQYGNGTKLTADGLYLSKIGTVKIKLHREPCGNIKTITIRRDRLGNWYACLSCEVDPQPLPPSSEVVGIDLGLSKFMALSNGEVIDRQRWMKRDEKDLQRIQRKLSKLPTGSAERRKAVRALNHVHTRIANRRRDFAHKVSRQLVNRFQIIAFEKLEVAEMSQNAPYKTISKGIADVAWARTVELTSFKAEWAGRTVVKVNPRGTTQNCSGCGQVVPKGLSVRVHNCPHCGLVIDRDLNAARNILSRGLATLHPNGVVEAHVLQPWE
jgi:putative transposase